MRRFHITHQVMFLLLCCICVSAARADMSGTYKLQGREGTVVTRMQVSGNRLQGVIEVPNGVTVHLAGTVTQNTAEGTATSAHGDGEFVARLTGDTLDLIVSQKDAPGQRALVLPLQFRRSPERNVSVSR